MNESELKGWYETTGILYDLYEITQSLSPGSSLPVMRYFDIVCQRGAQVKNELKNALIKKYGWDNQNSVRNIHLKINDADFHIPSGTEIWTSFDPFGVKILGKHIDMDADLKVISVSDSY